MAILTMALLPAAHAQVHGCTPEAAEDFTDETEVVLQWSLPHDRCILISPGTTVTWNGNFNSHPLAGGISDNKDESSPISSPGDNIGSVTFNDIGDFPYFCRIHIGNMTGVIYVRASAPGNFSKTSPADAASGQSTVQALIWSASSGASSYEYCIDTSDDSVCNSSWIHVVAGTSADPGELSTLTTYFWQVRAMNGGGTTEANGGSWWRFTTSEIAEGIFDDGFEAIDP